MPQYQMVHIPVGGGIDEHADPKALSMTGALQVENGVFRKDGSIEKRHGSDLIPSDTTKAGTLGGLTRLVSVGDELLACDGHKLYSYADTLSAWAEVDRVAEPVLTRTHLAQADTSLVDPDCAIANGIAVHAYVKTAPGSATGQVWATAVDTASGARVFSDVVLDNAATNHSVRCIAVGRYVLVLYAQPAKILVQKIDTLDVAGFFPAASTITSSLGTGPGAIFDACTLSSAAWAIAYNKSDTTLQVETYDTNLVQQHTASRAVAPVAGLGIDGRAGETIYIAYGLSGPSVVAWAVTDTLATSWGPTTVDATITTSADKVAVARIDATRAAIVYSTNFAGDDFRRQVVAAASGPTGPKHAIFGLALASRPLVEDGRAYCAAVLCASTAYQTTVLVDLAVDDVSNSTGSFRVVARAKQGQAAFLRSYGALSTPVRFAPGVWWIDAQSRASLDPIVGKRAIDTFVLDFADRRAQAPAVVSDTLVLSGGVPQVYTGKRLVECGFEAPPVAVSSTPATTGGLMADGTYQFRVCYEWYDERNGQLHRSSPSDAVTAVVSGGSGAGSVSLSIPCLQLTARQDNEQGMAPPVAIVVYRTQAGGTTFYRDTAIETPTSSENVVGQQRVTYTSTQADADLATQPLLYTTGGVLPSDPPPSSPLALVHRGRLWLAGGDDPTVVYYTKPVEPGVAPEFSLVLTIRVPDGGPITGLASLGQALIVFKRDRIFRVFGDGANALGQGSTLSPPDALPFDVGCIDARSIVPTRDGVFFQSAKGIHVLTSSFDVQYVGKNVEDTLATYPDVQAACALLDEHQVVWFLRDEAIGVVGCAAVYDTHQRAWSTWTYEHAMNAACVRGARLYYGSGFQYGDGGGGLFGLWRQAASSRLDDGTYVSMRWQSPHVEVGGMQGFQRVRDVLALCDKLDAHDLHVGIVVDYAAAAAYEATWTDEQISALAREQVRLHAAKKCEAISVILYDTAPDDSDPGYSGAGFRLNSVALRIGVKGTPYKALPAGAKA